MTDRTDDALLVRLQGLFGEELQDNVRLLGDGVARLAGEQRRDERVELVRELFRAAHSLKGAAHAAGVTAAIEPCRRLEDVLAELRAGHREVDEAVLDALTADVATLARLEHREPEASFHHREPEASLQHREPEASLQHHGPGAVSAGAGEPPAGIEPGPDRQPARDPGRAGPAGPRARVAVVALEELLHEAGSLVAVSQRLHLLADELLALRTARAGRRSSGPAPSSGDVELLERVADEAGAIERELSGTAGRVAHSALHLRMQPFDDVTAGFDHLVGDLARAAGKEARVAVDGGEVELDREIGSALREPLLHLVRNAVRHGIEEPGRRALAGKPPTGTVRLGAALDGGRVRITVADDGAGLDVAALRQAAGDLDLTAEEAVELAFRPGVSTADEVDDVSGRGVGLDAVRARVESLGGTVQLHPGNGRRGGLDVVLEVPVTLALLQVVLVEVGDQLVALPTDAVQRLRPVDPHQVHLVEGRLLIGDGGDLRPAVPLAAALGFTTSVRLDEQLAVELAGEDGALLVDRAVGEQEALLQRLPDRVASGMVIGAVLLPSDGAALVVNPATCVRVGAHGARVARPVTDRRRARILLVEDAPTTRLLEHTILAAAGYEVLDAADGAEAWRLLRSEGIDLVVSDVDLPLMSGIELCHAIRAAPRLAHLPVVLVTSLGSAEDRRRGAEAGADAYLIKSALDQAALLDAVGRLL